jgi:thiamine biosynthesis protein ThiI
LAKFYSYMGVTLKRMMLRAASRLAEPLKLDALVTGEAISQVSSQTLPNLSVIDSATEMLVLRPLIASHKQDIIDTAEAIGSAELHEEAQLDMAVLERAVARARLLPIDRVIDELGQDLQVEEVCQVLPGQVVIDIRHPDQVDDAPLLLSGIEVQALPFYAVNNRFKELDDNRQYLLYCDRGVMSRLHAHHLLSEGYANVRVYRPA